MITYNENLPINFNKNLALVSFKRANVQSLYITNLDPKMEFHGGTMEMQTVAFALYVPQIHLRYTSVTTIADDNLQIATRKKKKKSPGLRYKKQDKENENKFQIEIYNNPIYLITSIKYKCT